MRRALGLGEPFARHAGQGPGRLQADGTNGVVEQRCEELEAQRRLGGLERPGGRAAHEGVRVLEARAHRVGAARARRPGAPARWRGRWRDGRRRGRRPAAAPPIRALPSSPRAGPPRSAGGRAARDRTRLPPAGPPSRPADPRGIACTRWAPRASPRDPGAGCGSCGPAGDRRPCRWWPACDSPGSRRRASPPPDGNGDEVSGTCRRSGSRDRPAGPAPAAARCAAHGSPSTSHLVRTSWTAGTSRTRRPRRGSDHRDGRDGPPARRRDGCRRAAGRARRRR